MGFRETPQAALDTADLIVTTRPRFNLEYFAPCRLINCRNILLFSFYKSRHSIYIFPELIEDTLLSTVKSDLSKKNVENVKR